MVRVRGRFGNPGARSRQDEDQQVQRARLEELRQGAAEGASRRLLIATLRVRVPPAIWTGPFSLRHPDVRLEALNRTEVAPELSVSDYWVSGTPPGRWAQEILGFPDVVRVESLAEVGEGCLYRIKYRNPPVIAVYRRLTLPMQFPLRIQAGFLTWEVVARLPEFRAIVDYGKRASSSLEILSIRRGPLRSHIPVLTESQHALLAEAMAAGYFAVPRSINLTGLARRLGRSKSAVSEGIAIIEKKLIESALTAGSLLP